ncbi:hypothetical protein RG47T_2582 [Mucilaginibacter polytrichastri]|uniref:Uncharacterized protein n=1 Tax=Mucilaginibacter polytrichastri TaxID=1302689 RepID=A0A1Q5ZZD2_9SPHI|nr:hypothetical protein RG47T_2582 [Mucilaginibacter polytrichastri]
MISEEIAGNNITITVQIGDYKCAYFEKNLIQGNDDLLIYYWITGLNNYLFTCSFVIDKDQENSFENENELIVIENIIKSIKIN